MSRCLRPSGAFQVLVDLAVISLIESGAMESKDFIRTENYNLRLKPIGDRKIVMSYPICCIKKVSYQGKESTWSYIMFLKVRELAHCLTSKKENLDLVKPEYEIEIYDWPKIFLRLRAYQKIDCLDRL